MLLYSKELDFDTNKNREFWLRGDKLQGIQRYKSKVTVLQLDDDVSELGIVNTAAVTGIGDV